jgi:hypothetical protein
MQTLREAAPVTVCELIRVLEALPPNFHDAAVMVATTEGYEDVDGAYTAERHPRREGVVKPMVVLW